LINNEEKRKYERDLLLSIKRYLFLDFNYNVKITITAFQIYQEDLLIEGLEKGADTSKIRKEEVQNMADMKEEEKKIYYDRIERAGHWFLQTKSNIKITPITLFIHKKIEESKQLNEKISKIEQLSKDWKKISAKNKRFF
jgi:hypothetical protein